MNHSICRQRLAHIGRNPHLGISVRDMSQRARPPKLFAPLHPEKGKHSDAPKLKGIVFDVDGTLWYELYFASSCSVSPTSLQSMLTPIYIHYIFLYEREKGSNHLACLFCCSMGEASGIWYLVYGSGTLYIVSLTSASL